MRVVIRDVGRMGLRLALGAAALYGLACGVLYTFQAALVYAPHTAIVATPDEVGLAYREAFFTTADGVRLTGWHLPLEEARGTRAADDAGELATALGLALGLGAALG